MSSTDFAQVKRISILASVLSLLIVAVSKLIFNFLIRKYARAYLYESRSSFKWARGKEPEKDGGINPRYILDTLMRHWYLFIIFIIMGVAAAWLYLRYATRVIKSVLKYW